MRLDDEGKQERGRPKIKWLDTLKILLRCVCGRSWVAEDKDKGHQFQIFGKKTKEKKM